MDMFSDVEWFAVVSQPGRAVEAHGRLIEQGYRSFLPMCRRVRKNRSKDEVVIKPLFGRYQFVGVGTEQPFHPIAHTRGVDYIVRLGGKNGIPIRVSPFVLRTIKSRCDADGGVVNYVPAEREPGGPKPRVWKEWTPNKQELRVLSGPFSDFLAVFEAGAGDAALVLVQLFGRQIRVEIPTELLEPVLSAA